MVGSSHTFVLSILDPERNKHFEGVGITSALLTQNLTSKRKVVPTTIDERTVMSHSEENSR